jgi:hypothetical protein
MSEQEERESHLRMVINSFIENSTLRDALDDKQALRVLNWGVGEVEKKGKSVADLPLDEAVGVIDAYADLLHDIMRYVNRFVRDVKDPVTEVDVPTWCKKLCDGVDELAGVSVDNREQIESLYKNRFLFSLEEIFDMLMGVLDSLEAV